LSYKNCLKLSKPHTGPLTELIGIKFQTRPLDQQLKMPESRE